MRGLDVEKCIQRNEKPFSNVLYVSRIAWELPLVLVAVTVAMLCPAPSSSVDQPY
jgi:hypothetical protein